MSELKRCPFCGGEAEMGRKRSCFDHWEQGDFIPRCKDTKCLGRLYRTYKTEEEAITAWNTRKPMERILERLEECKETHDRRLLSKKETASFKIKELQFSGCYQNAIEIVKEEGGIE